MPEVTLDFDQWRLYLSVIIHVFFLTDGPELNESVEGLLPLLYFVLPLDLPQIFDEVCKDNVTPYMMKSKLNRMQQFKKCLMFGWA